MPEIAPLPEPLYAAIGHMTLAAAALEWMVAGCLVVVGDTDSSDAETASMRPVSTNIGRLRRWLGANGRVDGEIRTSTSRWLDDAKAALNKRNRIVHSVSVMNAGTDGSPALLHPRSGDIHLPAQAEMESLVEELLRCQGIGLQRQTELARVTGYGR